MGIRFYCPNGHKMNVKEFQAGKTGICPVCEVKMQIPLESTRPSSRQEQSPSPTSILQNATIAQQPPGTVSPTPSKKSDSSAALVFAASPESPEAAPVLPESDPLAVSANVVWYVRPFGGGQFGPATTDVFRDWLAEGRLSPDSLVWREGWSEWKEAKEVFGQLSFGQTIPGIESIEPEPIASLVHGHAPKSHVPSKKMQLMAFGVLALTVLILTATFLVIWMKQ